ncbi:hypothetical protein [Companilactobacillus sp.]|uniref:hypothetical protein n=1 Tax=Companilactobacillus sp. TaxID=2767905 RepID=UPI002639553C|nr:hypothetical protein [Companilactobacillus sp.]
MSRILPVRVIVRPMNDANPDHDRIINQYDAEDRKWLARTAYWAMHNDRIVTSYPVSAA